MEIPCLQQTKGDHLVVDGNEVVNEFVSTMLEAFMEPDNVLNWEKVQDYLQALGHIPKNELRERRDLIHYLKRFLYSLNSEKIPIKSRLHLLPHLHHLLDTLSITKDCVKPHFEAELTMRNDVKNIARRPSSRHNTSQGILYLHGCAKFCSKVMYTQSCYIQSSLSRCTLTLAVIKNVSLVYIRYIPNIFDYCNQSAHR